MEADRQREIEKGALPGRSSAGPIPACAAVAVLTFLAYIPALSNDFVNWDDTITVVENRHIRSLDLESLGWMATTFHNGNWIPLNWLSHAFVHGIAGLDPFAHHLANVFVHALNTALALLVFLAVLRLALGPEGAGGANARGRDVVIAAAAALFWGVHPLHVESVAWVTERKDVGSTFFFLLSILAYLGYASAREKRLARLALCLVLFVLSLLFKPMAVTLPVVLLLLDWWPLGRLAPPFKRVLVEKAPFFAVSLVFGLVAIQAQGSGVMTFERVPVAFRVMNALHSIVFYLQKMLVPIDLAPLYPIVDAERTAFSAAYILSAVLVAAITVACAVLWRRGRAAPAAAWLFYLATLGPVLGILQVGRQAAADRYTYIPGLGLALLLAAGAAALQGRLERSVPEAGKARPVALLFAVGLIALGLACAGQCKVWKDSITLWERQIVLHPGVEATAYSNLAKAYRTAGRIDDAILAYRDAMMISEPHPYTHDGLGCALLDKARALDEMNRKDEADRLVDEAVGEFKKALAKDPEYAAPHRNLWYAYRRKGMEMEALATVRRAVELSDDFAEAFNNMGISYMQIKRFPEAENAFRRALALEPGNFEYLSNLAALCMRTGRVDEAAGLYRKALELRPDHPHCWFNLGIALERAGNRVEAVRCHEKALELDSRLAAAHIALCRIHVDLGDLDRARRHFEAAVALGGRVDPALRRRLFDQ